MTANQMWDNVLVTYDALYSQSAPGFEDAEATILLTKAQWYYILQRLNPKSNRNMEGFEETEIRIQGLSALVKDSQDAVPPVFELQPIYQTGTLPGEKLWALPVDFMIPIYESTVTNVPQCGTTSTYNRMMTIPISHDDYNLSYANPYKRPYCNGSEGLVWRLEHGKKIVLGVERKIHGIITDGTFDVTNYYLRYLRYPNDIVVNLNTPALQVSCELDSLTHQGICDIAVKLLSAAVREQIPINQLTADSLE
jgi:hypothetical protein